MCKKAIEKRFVLRKFLRLTRKCVNNRKVEDSRQFGHSLLSKQNFESWAVNCFRFFLSSSELSPKTTIVLRKKKEKKQTMEACLKCLICRNCFGVCESFARDDNRQEIVDKKWNKLRWIRAVRNMSFVSAAAILSAIDFHSTHVSRFHLKGKQCSSEEWKRKKCVWKESINQHKSQDTQQWWTETPNNTNSQEIKIPFFLLLYQQCMYVAFLRYLLAALETNLFLEIYFFSILSIYHGDDDAWTTKMEREEERVIGSVFWTRQDCLAPKNHTLFHFSLLTFFFSPLSMDVSLPTLRCMSRSWFEWDSKDEVFAQLSYLRMKFFKSCLSLSLFENLIEIVLSRTAHSFHIEINATQWEEKVQTQ